MRSSLDNSKDFLFFRSLSPDGFRCRLTVPEAMTSSSFLFDLFFFFASSERLLSSALLMMEDLGQEICPLDEVSPAWFRDLIPTYDTRKKIRCFYHHWNHFCLMIKKPIKKLYNTTNKEKPKRSVSVSFLISSINMSLKTSGKCFDGFMKEWKCDSNLINISSQMIKAHINSAKSCWWYVSLTRCDKNGTIPLWSSSLKYF